MPVVNTFKFKICLVGEGAVGKTSIIRRFVVDQFDDRYLTTIGIKTTKKNIKIKHPNFDRLLDVNLIIWDVIGQKSFRHLIQDDYFFGARGIIGVCDVTRKDTLLGLESWIETVQKLTQEIPIVFLGNKCDLVDKQEVDVSQLENFTSKYKKSVAYLSSAKTGLNIELAFRTLCEKILIDMV